MPNLSPREAPAEDGKGYERVSIRERLSHFTWSWFECTMSTGAIATVLGQQPFTFPGLMTIGKIFFILDIVLFLLFCCLITIRFIMRPSALGRSLHHPHESFFFGTFWVSIALILYCTQLYAVPVCGPWLVKALEVCFWSYGGCAILVVCFQYHIIFDSERLPVTETMPAWLFPAYPFLVLGPLAAVLEYSQPQYAALPILIGGLVFQGLGWSIAFIMYTLYFTRLINSELPEESKRPGMYVAVGPAGLSFQYPHHPSHEHQLNPFSPKAYTANALVALGSQATTVLPDHFLGTTTLPVGEVWKAIGLPVGLFLWLLGFWFMAVASISVLVGARKMHFTLNCWAFIFPNVGLTIALIQIGNVLGSNGIKGVASAMTIVLMAAWLIVSVFCVKAVVMGQILWPGMDEDMEDIEGHGKDEAGSKERRE